MPTAIKVKSPSFYKVKTPTAPKSSGDSKPLILAMLVIVGVAVIFIMRGRDKAMTGPVLTVIPSNATDVSSLNNITQALQAKAGQVYAASATPSGGVSSPTTPTH